MDTSDESLLSGGNGKVSIPTATKQAENVRRTAEPLEQVSEEGRRRRRRRQASFLTSGFGEPQLGIPGLTGLQTSR